MNEEVVNTYGNRLRLRVCGVCWHEGKLLMVRHEVAGGRSFWAPPGGGVEFGEPLSVALEREFAEESGVTVKTTDFLFGCEFVQPPLHAVELFFRAEWISGVVRTGYDPELPIIREVRFLSEGELRTLHPGELHGIFRHAATHAEFSKLGGFYRI